MWDNQYFLNIDNSQFTVHWHMEIEILFCIEGYIEVEIDGIPYIVSENEAIIINSLEEHELLKTKSGNKTFIIEIGYGLLGSNFGEFINKRIVEPIIKFNNNTDIAIPRLHSLINNLINEYENGKDTFDNKWMIKSHLFELAALIWRYIPMIDDASDKKAMKLKQIMTIQPVLDYIIENYNKSITLNDAATIAGYELKSFCRAFKNATGMSFHKYLNLYRINQACMMIEYGQYSLNKIGELCGINQAKSFSRLFKQYKCMTPTEYKSNITKGGIR